MSTVVHDDDDYYYYYDVDDFDVGDVDHDDDDDLCFILFPSSSPKLLRRRYFFSQLHNHSKNTPWLTAVLLWPVLFVHQRWIFLSLGLLGIQHQPGEESNEKTLVDHEKVGPI